MRAETGWRVSLAARNRKQGGNQRDRLFTDGRVNESLQLCGPVPRVIVAPEAGRPFELSDHRIERAVLMIRRAVKTQHRSIGQAVPEGVDQTRLPNTRLS